MFTGLVEYVGLVRKLVSGDVGCALHVESGLIADGASIGDSVAINGCCLTVVKIVAGELIFEAGTETLQRTNLGELGPGDRVNLERAMRPTDRLGGHFVSGHIDAVGKVVARTDDGEWSEFRFEVPAELTQQMAPKGSIAVDGISLTLVDVAETDFTVALIPHTLQVTILGAKRPGDSVNIETDILAKYVQRQIASFQRS